MTPLVRVCAWCRRTHTDTGRWRRVSLDKRDAPPPITHALCPECRDGLLREQEQKRSCRRAG